MAIVNEEKSWLEWLVFGLSSILILMVFVYLVRDACKDQGRPPDLRIELGSSVSSSHGFVVPVSVTNKGDQIAQAIEIEISTLQESRQVATLNFEFLSSGETQKGWVGFSGSPTHELASRVVGYRTSE